MVTVSIAGDQLHYKEKCRVKHMLTQKYLAIVYEEGTQQHRVRHFCHGTQACKHLSVSMQNTKFGMC